MEQNMRPMPDPSWLVEQFEANRAHLRRVAYRMLESRSEADDAVQEAWIRLRRADTSGVGNLGGWLQTVLARVCLDMLRSRRSRREESLESRATESVVASQVPGDPEQRAMLADSVGLALLAVLETLGPAERVAFVLHDMFDLPFDEIAPIVGRTPAAARQLASRARRRVRGAAASRPTDHGRQREIVGAFLTASSEGDFAGLLAVLDPGVVLRADAAAVLASAAREAAGAPKLAREVRGAAAVAEAFAGRAHEAQLALVDGAVGAVWAPGGRPRAVFRFTVSHGKIAGIDVVVDPERVRALEVAYDLSPGNWGP
jgi:RNA polymerase sigma-70 factor (ECF subfamily)